MTFYGLRVVLIVVVDAAAIIVATSLAVSLLRIMVALLGVMLVEHLPVAVVARECYLLSVPVVLVSVATVEMFVAIVAARAAFVGAIVIVKTRMVDPLSCVNIALLALVQIT